MDKKEVIECIKKEINCRRLGCPDHVLEDETCLNCEYYTTRLTEAMETVVSLLEDGEKE